MYIYLLPAPVPLGTSKAVGIWEPGYLKRSSRGQAFLPINPQSLSATHTPCSCFSVLAEQIQNIAKAWRGLHTMYIYFGVDS